MSPLASLRLAAVLFSLLAFGCQVGLRLLRRANPTVSGWLFELVALLALGLVAAAYLAVIAPYRRPPASFALTPGRFSAPSSPYNGLGTLAFGWLAGYLIAWPAVAIPVFCAGLLSFVPMVALTPTHLVVRHLWTRRFPWERVGPGSGATKRGAVELEVLTLLGKWRTVVLGPRTRHVESAFLGRSIQEYVDNADSRAQIGTEEELARLKALPPKAVEETVTEAWPQWLPSEREQA
jgi:hypothetical protein